MPDAPDLEGDGSDPRRSRSASRVRPDKGEPGRPIRW